MIHGGTRDDRRALLVGSLRQAFTSLGDTVIGRREIQQGAFGLRVVHLVGLGTGFRGATTPVLRIVLGHPAAFAPGARWRSITIVARGCASAAKISHHP